MIELQPVPEDNPYKHSLSLSFWNTAYFTELVKGDITIWDFERLPQNASSQTLYTPKNLCSYNHIVEKGQLSKFAQKLQCASSIQHNGRALDGHLTYAIRWFRAHIVFFFLGYTFANRRFRREESGGIRALLHPGDGS